MIALLALELEEIVLHLFLVQAQRSSHQLLQAVGHVPGHAHVPADIEVALLFMEHTKHLTRQPLPQDVLNIDLGLVRQAGIGCVHLMQHPLAGHLQHLLPVEVVLFRAAAPKNQGHAAALEPFVLSLMEPLLPETAEGGDARAGPDEDARTGAVLGKLEAAGTSHKAGHRVLGLQAAEPRAADAMVQGTLAISGAVREHGHSEVDLRGCEVPGGADGVVPGLQNRELGEQEAGRYPQGREFLQHLQECGAVGELPLVVI